MKPIAQVQHPAVVHLAPVRAPALAPKQEDPVRRAFVVGGLGGAALLFLLVLTVPATGLRFTAAGRLVIDHQTDLVVAGIAALVLTGLLFAVTGTG